MDSPTTGVALIICAVAIAAVLFYQSHLNKKERLKGLRTNEVINPNRHLTDQILMEHECIEQLTQDFKAARKDQGGNVDD